MDKDKSSEYIWADDFRNRNISSIVASLGCGTYGELSEIEVEQFEKLHLSSDEIQVIESLLTTKGLCHASSTPEPN